MSAAMRVRWTPEFPEESPERRGTVLSIGVQTNYDGNYDIFMFLILRDDGAIVERPAVQCKVVSL